MTISEVITGYRRSREEGEMSNRSPWEELCPNCGRKTHMTIGIAGQVYCDVCARKDGPTITVTCPDSGEDTRVVSQWELKEIRWIKRLYSAVEGRVEKYRLFNISYDGITPLKYDDPHWYLRTTLPPRLKPMRAT